jgi:hypothetical protein
VESKLLRSGRNFEACTSPNNAGCSRLRRVSRRIFVGEVGDPRASQSVSQAVQAFSVFKHFQERKKREKGCGLINYHHRKQRKGK